MQSSRLYIYLFIAMLSVGAMAAAHAFEICDRVFGSQLASEMALYWQEEFRPSVSGTDP